MEQLKEFTLELENKLQDFKTEVESLNEEQLHSLEEEIINEIEDYEKVVFEKQFDLSSEVVFDGDKHSFNEVVGDILYLINKNEVEYKFTLGLYELYNFWKSADKTMKITYSVLDSTLRILGQIKFTGYSEWKRILVINEFFKPNHVEYTKINAMQVFYAQKHNIVMDKLQLLKPVDANAIDESEVMSR